MTRPSLAKHANVAFDLNDMATFDWLFTLSGREFDAAVKPMETEEIEALLEVSALHRGQGVYS